MKNIVFLSGAGISAESGIKTFRDSGGLWEGHNVMEVASLEGWVKNNALILDFYNQRRRDVIKAKPNAAHIHIAELEKKHKVTVVTQNVDDLHERAGSTNIIHLHGEIRKSRSTRFDNDIYEIEGSELNIGDVCKKGFQLRPHIVWFGELVPMMENAMNIVLEAEILVVIGTSLAVYPAASLLNYTSKNTPVFYIDPKVPDFIFDSNVTHIQETASKGMEILISKYL